jgi:hypothetical protein
MVAPVVDRSWRGGAWGLPYRATDFGTTALSHQAGWRDKAI